MLRGQVAQPRQTSGLQGYILAGPQPPASVDPTDSVVSELKQIQSTLLWMMHKMDFEEDYGGAIVAAQQATETAKLIGAITERLELAKRLAACQSTAAITAREQSQASADEANPKTAAPLYLIAFKDHTVETATKYWTDGVMLHYFPSNGAHVQVRLGLVDRALSQKLNREKNLEFDLPERRSGFNGRPEERLRRLPIDRRTRVPDPLLCQERQDRFDRGGRGRPDPPRCWLP